MPRKRKLNPTVVLEEGSSSGTKTELPWVGRAIFTIHPINHWKKPPPGVIHYFEEAANANKKELATIRRQKRRHILVHRQTQHPINDNEASFESLIHGLTRKLNRISRKLNLLHLRSQPRITCLPTVEPFTLGAPSCLCEFCKASMWKEESTHVSRNMSQPHFQLCCRDGNVKLPMGREPPLYLKELLQSDNQNGNHFRKEIRGYNAAFCFTSLGGKVNRQLNNGTAPYIYSIGGQIFHRIGALLPLEGNAPQFSQLYIVDSENEVQCRMNSICKSVETNKLQESIISSLKDMFDEHNNLATVFRFARDCINAGGVRNVRIKLHAGHANDGREYDLPSVDELAALIVDETGQDTFQPDIVIEYLSVQLERILYYHPSLMALQYPILFPYGEDGWHGDIIFGEDSNTTRRLSQCDFYAYRIQTRVENQQHILLCGKLFQQYVVNEYALVEAERLDWMRNNQRKLRKHYFHGLRDAYNRGDMVLEQMGKHIILAATHLGSPRCKYENFQDAMAICRILGYPDLFITFTCNAGWPKIQLMVDLVTNHGRADPNRADVMARVFKLKLNQLMLEVKKISIFGQCIAC